eukprot:CAMPEP_0119015850 /NCGR_PEP_ID=MMETSP1176-20130426/11686_1 /TAXON_ID=265551 /ORGANISM="Synedropsis recta cf, Strain CCMP1620" /LENGTH=436 /DNA_ID=CAMNT_0006969173 /DNA_START=8 /DNA_END=1321 /DNA_ORIENTATION=-
MRFLFTFLTLVSLALASDLAPTVAKTRRERFLDHLDPETLAYYLGLHPTTLEPIEQAEGDYVGFDVAVMFYAQWDQNSHALAPYWDNIGERLKAGSKQSKLVMGLFNCELDYQHVQLCAKAGITSYPTMLFIGAGPFHDTDPFTSIVGKDRSAGPAGAAPLPRTVKFQGNWQYTDSVKDWVKAMQGLSSWHKFTDQGMLKNFRKGLMGFFHTKKFDKSSLSLPIGVPGGTVVASDVQTSVLENKLDVVEAEGKLMEKAATHASLLLDNVLFPPENQDAFSTLLETGGWDKTSPHAELQVLRTCVTELSLDYCSRLSTRVTSEYLEKAVQSGVEVDMSNIEEIEEELRQTLAAIEPYCALYDECYTTDFAAEQCRPATCPLQAVGCAYLTACFDETVETEYAVALGLIKEGETFPPPAVQKKPPAGDSKSKGWGFFG